VPILLTACNFIAGFERNWWSDCHECHLESFLVWYTTEDSFIISVACGKKWGGSSLAALQKFTPMAVACIECVTKRYGVLCNVTERYRTVTENID